MEGEKRSPHHSSWKFSAFACASQLMFLALFAGCVEWPPELKSYLPTGDGAYLYPMWQDVHVMMYIGFGFLLVFPGKNMWTSVGMCFAMGIYTFQWALLCNGFFNWVEHGMVGKVQFHLSSLLGADFCVASILIAYSALIGKLGPFQLLFMCFCQTLVFAVNEYICFGLFKVQDAGGSMTTHAFGCYFGLALSWAYSIGKKPHPIGHQNNVSHYYSDLFAMIGSLFLWLYWPSYNAALVTYGGGQDRAVINTVVGIAASALVTFFICYSIRGKFSMVDIQNATLAGGVGVGTICDLSLDPWACMLVGMVSGAVSCLGYIFLLPFLEKCIRLHDPAGINNLHGMPGIISGLAAVFTSLASQGDYWYGYHIGHIFDARSPSNATLALLNDLEPGDGRSANRQAGFQMAALAVSVFFALFAGLITGCILRLPFFFDGPEHDQMYDDRWWWLHAHPTGTDKKDGLHGHSQKNFNLENLDKKIHAGNATD